MKILHFRFVTKSLIIFDKISQNIQPRIKINKYINFLVTFKFWMYNIIKFEIKASKIVNLRYLALLSFNSVPFTHFVAKIFIMIRNAVKILSFY